jgi:hypothetical protein
MRILPVLITLVCALLFAAPGAAMAAHIKVSVTPDQVKNVCGKNFDGTGCLVGCYGGTTCNFECHKGKCTGEVFMQSSAPAGEGRVSLLGAAKVLGACSINPATHQGYFGCSVPCDLQMCDYRCVTQDLCIVYQHPKQAKLEPENLAPTTGGRSNATVPVLY